MIVCVYVSSCRLCIPSPALLLGQWRVIKASKKTLCSRKTVMLYNILYRKHLLHCLCISYYIFTYCQSVGLIEQVCLFNRQSDMEQRSRQFAIYLPVLLKMQQQTISKRYWHDKSHLCVCVKCWWRWRNICVIICTSARTWTLRVAPMWIYWNYHLASSKSKHMRQSINSAGSIWSISNAETCPTECCAEQLIMSWKHKALSLNNNTSNVSKSLWKHDTCNLPSFLSR